MRPIVGLVAGVVLAQACFGPMPTCEALRLLLVGHEVVDAPIPELVGEEVVVAEESVRLAYTRDGVRYQVRLSVVAGVVHQDDGPAITLPR